MILNSPYISGSLTVTGNTTIQGQLTVTGSLSGTASLASNALLLQGTGSTGFATTSSLLQVSSSQQQISSSQQQISSSLLTLTASFNAVSASQQQISSSQQQISASLLNVIAVYATTGSNSFRATQSITGSLTVTGQIIAQTLNVQQVTSSIIYSSGSNNFGCDLNSRQTFTGSVNITGSQTIFGNVGIGLNNATNRLEVQSGDIKLNAGASRCTNIFFGLTGTNYGKIQYSDIDGSMLITTIGSGAGYDLNLGTQCTTRLTILGDGKVGIGTGTPLSTFHANCCVAGGATTTVARFGVQDSTGYGTTSPAIELTGTNIGLSFTMGKIAGINDVSSGGSLAFSTGLCAGTVVERMRITSAGITCFANTVCVPSLRATSVDISAGSSAAFSFGVDHQSTFAFGGLNGKRVAIIRDGTCADNGLQFGYDVVDKTGVIAGSATAAGVGIDFYTYNGSAWGNRIRLTKDGLTCFSSTICTPKIGYNGYGGITAHDLVGHFASDTTIATVTDFTAYTRVSAHIEWVANYALAGTNMTMGYTITDTRRGNSNTMWVNCACTILAYGDIPVNPTFSWNNGVLTAYVPGSTGLSARFRIMTYVGTLTANI